MLERKQYERPPLIEVFCEFFFEPAGGAEWALSLGKFYKELGEETYPKTKRTEGVGVEVQLALSESTKTRRDGASSERHQFISVDGNSIVQAGENLLVLNQFPPYYGWERFVGEVRRVLDIYQRAWPVKSVTRAALHYIDRVDVPGETVEIEEYFKLHPTVPESFASRPVTNLAMAFETAGESKGDLLAVTFHQQPSAHPGRLSFRFQWDYVGTVPRATDVESLVQWLEVAHGALSDAFRSTITKRCELLFAERKEPGNAGNSL